MSNQITAQPSGRTALRLLLLNKPWVWAYVAAAAAFVATMAISVVRKRAHYSTPP